MAARKKYARGTRPSTVSASKGKRTEHGDRVVLKPGHNVVSSMANRKFRDDEANLAAGGQERAGTKTWNVGDRYVRGRITTIDGPMGPPKPKRKTVRKKK